ncbi:hypothetical protein NDR87_05320 [Nocardia sp. CDC159]|uniref:Mce-associated membrane protein n=1 Tax=Nocardia pulmonis TaxID=2951408 RepID=A0A9X2E777_9NOCA|nr:MULTISPECIES: hypothetical protein [Nocardia]MCM6772921.1 hypothetical protein [Nocardia pulmonis]MCM6785776.1 hypothetical protein [Nocardia sp. CDC159]
MTQSSATERSRRRVVRAAGPPAGEPPAVETITVRKAAPVEPAPSSSATEIDEVASPATEPGTTEPAERPRSRARLGWLEWTAMAAAIVALAGVLVGGGLFLHHRQTLDARAEREAAFVQTAKQAILNLTTITGDTAQQDIDRVLAVASGELKAEYSQRKDAYAQVVQQAKVKASGEIVETAIESEDDTSARILVAAKQTLTNAGSADPQQRFYRFRVTVTRDGSTTTAAQVEFVA